MSYHLWISYYVLSPSLNITVFNPHSSPIKIKYPYYHHCFTNGEREAQRDGVAYPGSYSW